MVDTTEYSHVGGYICTLPSTPYTKIISKCIKEQVKANTIELLEENKGIYLHDFVLHSDFLDIILKAQLTKKGNK